MIKTPEQKLSRNPQNAGYSNPLKSYDVPAKDNPDGTINVHSQPVYGIDPNHEPIDLYMATRQIPGGILRVYASNGAVGAGGLVVTPAVPAGKRLRVMSVQTDYTASATVGNRILYTAMNDANGVVWVGALSAALAAAQIGGYDVGFGVPIGTPSTAVRRTIALTANTNVQVREMCPVTDIGFGFIAYLDDAANIDNADTIAIRTVYMEYDA